MADEKACGVIIYKNENNTRKYVIIRGVGIYQGYYGFPKGHMEPGETEQIIKREVLGIAQSKIVDEMCVERINHLIEKSMYPDARNLLKSGYTVRMNRMSSQADISHSVGVLITAMEQRKRIRFQYEIIQNKWTVR